MKRIDIFGNTNFLMIILLIFWCSFTAVSKLTLKNMDSFQVQFYIFAFAALTITIFIVTGGRYKALTFITFADYVRLALFAIPQFLYFFLYTLSLKMIPVMEAAALNYLFPVFIVILAVPINKEKLTLRKILSILTGFAGVTVIITNGRLDLFEFSDVYGDLLALGAAFSCALFSSLGKMNRIDPLVSNFIYSVVGFVLSFIAVLLFSTICLPGTGAVAGCLWLSMSNVVLTCFIWFKVLKQSSSSKAAVLSYLAPFFTLLFLMLLAGEKLTIASIIGTLVIFAGTMVQTIRSFPDLFRKRNKKQKFGRYFRQCVALKILERIQKGSE